MDEHASPDVGSTLLAPDLLVLELGRRGAAGFCGSLLAGLGAEVVLAEPLDARTDKWRSRGPVAAGKRSVHRAALERGGDLRDLLDTADVLLLSSDLDPDEREFWSGARPQRQIVCDVTAFGHTGPLSGHGLPEPLVEAMSGAVDTTGQRSGPPVLTGAPFVEMETAVYAASAVIAALRARRSSGFGQRIDVSIYDVGVNAMAVFIPLALTGGNASRKGNRHPASSPWNNYPTRDGDVLICVSTDEQWARLCDAMGTPALVSDLRFATATARRDNADEIDAVVGDWTAGLTVSECQRQMQEHVIPAGPIVALDDLGEEPNIAHRRAVSVVADPASGRRLELMTAPVRVAGETRRQPSLPAPDENREAVCAHLRRRRAAISEERVSGDPVIAERPLQGLRVVEVAMNTVGPLAGKQLAALGADVIKVEPPSGDTNRTSPPLREGGGSYNFAIANPDKRGLVLNLKDERDAATLWRLLGSADVLIENLKPGSLARLGFGAEQVRERFPEIVYCSVNGFGFDTAYPGRPAFDTVIQATSGAMSATVDEDGVPLKSGLSLADQLGGQFGLLSVLAAIDRRDRTGVGATLDIAMQECTAWATQGIWNGCSRTPASVAAVADGYVVVAGAHIPADHLARLTRAEAVGAHPETVAPVLGVTEVLEHPQTLARELFFSRAAADGEEWPLLGSPLRLGSTPARVEAAMAGFGHLDPRLATELGLEAGAAVSRAEAVTR